MLNRTPKTRRRKERLQAQIAAKGLTQAELARQLGMSDASLSMKLSGVVKFSLTEALELERLVGIPARDLAQVA